MNVRRRNILFQTEVVISGCDCECTSSCMIKVRGGGGSMIVPYSQAWFVHGSACIMSLIYIA